MNDNNIIDLHAGGKVAQSFTLRIHSSLIRLTHCYANLHIYVFINKFSYSSFRFYQLSRTAFLRSACPPPSPWQRVPWRRVVFLWRI